MKIVRNGAGVLVVGISNSALASSGDDVANGFIAIVVVAIFFVIAIKILKLLFKGAVAFGGWIAPMIKAAIPAAGVYLVTHFLFGFGLAEASGSAIFTAGILGLVFGMSG